MAMFVGVAGGASSVHRNSEAQPIARNGSVLVAYMSRSGNTRVVAGQISRALRADLFEIRPAAPYPEDYRQTVEQAKQETEASYEPPLNETVRGMADYQVVLLGFPIWGMTAPPPIRSFLSRHDLAGKTVVPFITHGGYGTGNSLDVVARHAPRAKRMDPFVLQRDQERDAVERVTQWLSRNPIGR
ncbi:MAG TPA: flavodoxin [Ramlibacter sp.]|nr:flavodoxin [Ramlibacter sp.]